MMLMIMMLLILMMITDDSKTLLPQYGVSQEVPFSAFEFLSCASWQKWHENCVMIIVLPDKSAVSYV